MERGYALSPPFTQMIVGHSRLFWLSIRQETFPELEVGSGVQVESMSQEIIADKHNAEATATITSVPPLGADMKIKLEDVDLGNQRYRWRQNVLEIAARHPSLRRYLGDPQQRFPGQDSKHFRVLIAEVVADAVCARLVRRNVQAIPEEFEDADWDAYYARYSKYMTGFLPKAHQLQCPEG